MSRKRSRPSKIAPKRIRTHFLMFVFFGIIALCVIALLQTKPAALVAIGVPDRTAHHHGAPPVYTLEVRDKAEKKVILLLATHPRREVHALLSALLTSSAMLDVTPSRSGIGANAASIFCFNLPDSEIAYGLGASYVWALDPGMTDESRYLTLWHEYTHWKDYQEKKTQVIVCRRDRARDETFAAAESLLRSELRAHLAECELATELGWDHPDGYCQRYQDLGPANFVRTVAGIYLERDPVLRSHANQLREITECFIAGN